MSIPLNELQTRIEACWGAEPDAEAVNLLRFWTLEDPCRREGRW